MKAILKKELNIYFKTPIAYVFIGMLISIGSIIFVAQNINNLSSDIPGFLAQLNTILIFLIPVLTMRMFCTEFSYGTNKLLFSNPISVIDIVLGKYISALIVFIVSAVLSLVFVFFTFIYGKIYFSEIALAYSGFILQAAALIAVDMFASSFSKNQIVAVIMAFGINIFLWIIDILSKSSMGFITKILNFISLYKRMEPFIIGQLSYASIAFFILFSICFILATIYRLNRVLYGGFRR
ncbi:MAG: ABC transporter permease subunit [Christensenellaceae bacterium]|nr:ABC transporter permease subunit [Christensenellaceae bacterium]